MTKFDAYQFFWLFLQLVFVFLTLVIVVNEAGKKYPDLGNLLFALSCIGVMLVIEAITTYI